MSARTLIFGASFALHIALGVWIGRMDSKGRGEDIAISVTEAEAKKKEEDKKPPPEPPKVEPKEPVEKRRQARAEPKQKAAPPEEKTAEPKENANPSAIDALPEFGLSLSGGVGGPGGVAVRAGNAAAPVEKKATTEKPTPRVLAPAPADACTEALVKPKPIKISQPAYTEAARAANVEGRVRVEVSVDAEGHVTSARVLAGLGHGLDEAALAAAKQATFSPGTRCGKAVAATFVIAMRFSL